MIRTCHGIAIAAAVISTSSAQCASAEPGSPPGLTQRINARPAPPLFRNSTAIEITASRFWADWERARKDASRIPAMKRLIAPAVGLSAPLQIAYVQSVVPRLIRWRSDTTQWGKHDYWASAAETLERGSGDSEDRAIVKMQALRALGIPSRNLFLTLGRDVVSGPETILVVGNGAGYLMLDDSAGAPFSPDRRPEFQPVLTFGFGATWVYANLTERASTNN